MKDRVRKRFQVTGHCSPNLHYMVSLSSRLAEIREMIEQGDYFTINRARQYGKTTVLKALEDYLEEEYLILSLDFQKLSYMDFETEASFVRALSGELLKKGERKGTLSAEIAKELQDFMRKNEEPEGLRRLFDCFSRWCGASEKPVVLMIDEVDSAANNQVFLDFLAQLRGRYMERDEFPTFQSVILAGVYDIKSLKGKIVSDGSGKTNSPWNIAADFLVDLSFSPEDIEGMLSQYEADHGTGMDVKAMAELIYDYTSGYPVLVSRICKLMDERITGSGLKETGRKRAWTKETVLGAVKILTSESNALFDSLIQKVKDYPELDKMLRNLLFSGKEITYAVGVPSIEAALMFGFVKRADNTILPANRIFETLLYDFFLASPDMQQDFMYSAALAEKSQFISSGHLNMKRIMEKFTLHFQEIYGSKPRKFLEEDGRRYFLLYLKPIINGKGNYYIEARTRSMERTDVIVDYPGEQFVIELKIWRGNAYKERGEEQLAAYLDAYGLKKGYMLSFNFNKNKETGVTEIQIGDKTLVEAVV